MSKPPCPRCVGSAHQSSTPCPNCDDMSSMEHTSLLTSPYHSDSHHPQNLVEDDNGVKKADYQHPPSYEKDGSSALGFDLPSGWTRLYDTHGKEYYINYITHVTQWEHPGGSMPYYADVDAKMSPSPPPPPAYGSTVPYPSSFSGVGITIHEDGHNESSSQPAELQRDLTHHLNQDKHTHTPLDVLTPKQLDDVAHRTIPIYKYDSKPACGESVCHILRNNILLTILSLLIWGLITTGLCIMLIVKNIAGVAAFGCAGMLYLMYLCCYVCPAGCTPICFMLCNVSSGLASERVVEALRAQTVRTSDIVVNNIHGAVNATPHLEIHVNCSHKKESTNMDGDKSTTTVTTYEAKRFIPIRRHKDISVQPAVIGEILDRCPSNTITITYDYLYELHPSQVEVLEGCMKQLYYDNWWRDDDVDITVKYSVIGYEEKRVDLLVKERNASESAVEYQNVKYLHIGIPSSQDDQVITGDSTSNKDQSKFHEKFREYKDELSAKNNPQLVNLNEGLQV